MKKLAFCLALPLALIAQNAKAAQILYTLTGSYTASFTLDDVPTAGPDASAPNYYFTIPGETDVFYVTNVTGTFGDHSGIGGITFYGDAADGGLTITFFNVDKDSYDVVNLTGMQLYSGSIDAPTLNTFGPTDFDDYDTPGAKSYTLSAQAVPEPASWALMIGGLGFVGMALRRRATTRVAFA